MLKPQDSGSLSQPGELKDTPRAGRVTLRNTEPNNPGVLGKGGTSFCKTSDRWGVGLWTQCPLYMLLF